MTIEEMVREWLKGCSCASAERPWECEECTEAFVNSVRKKLPQETRGCGAKLKPGQHWAFCGETDMGQTEPALCNWCDPVKGYLREKSPETGHSAGHRNRTGRVSD